MIKAVYYRYFRVMLKPLLGRSKSHNKYRLMQQGGHVSL